MIFKDKLSFILKFLRFVLFPLYFISYFIPKKKNLWVFGAHQNRFSENSKALFLYISNNDASIQTIWITGDRGLAQVLREQGYSAYRRWSFTGLYYSLRAKYYFYNVYSDDINFYTSGNVNLVNLWHGIPLKHIEFDTKKGPLKKVFNSKWVYLYGFLKPYIYRDPDYVLSTSKSITNIFSSAFRVKKIQCLEFGYPRTDSFFKQEINDTFVDTSTKELLEELYTKQKKDNKVLVYMPTWRSNNKDFFKEAIPDFDKLNNILSLTKITMIIKLHPNTKSVEGNFTHIVFVKSEVDIYKVLPLSDYLMTDYSSVYFDYLLLDKEMLFYAFDYNTYINEDRDLYFNYLDKTPGEKIYDFETLLDILSRLDKLDHTAERQELKDEVWKYQDSNASKRICNYFKEI